MRVCIITPRYPPDRCGVGDYTALLARHLSQRGIEVTVVTSRDGSAAYGRSVRGDTGDRLEAGGPRDGGVTVLPVVAAWGWAVLPRLCGLALAGRYDVVHIQYQNEMYGRSAAIAALPAALRALRPRLPVVVTVHDYGTPWPRHVRVRAIAGPYGKAWFAVMLWTSRRVILTNEQDQWRFTRQRPRYHVPASRYVVIPVGSNLPAVETPAPAGRDEALTIGYFGFVNPAKGVETLLDAFALARRERPSLRLRLVCALRSDDPYHVEMLRKLDDLALCEAVTVTGDLPDAEAAAALGACDVVALPFRDGVSLRRTTLVAAMALGRPVVSTRSAIPPATLEDGRDLVLVPPCDVAALASALVALADDPARRIALGSHARFAAAAFAWPAIAERTDDVYRQVLRSFTP